MTKYEVPDREFITVNDMKKRYGTFDPNVFKRWVDEGKVRKLRNGLYRNESRPMQGDWDKYLVANALYPPSYVSLISALRFYNFIPETVYSVSSVSTRKTKVFRLGRLGYIFKSIKPSLFFGYTVERWRGDTFCMATPEKAILDLAYYEPQFYDHDWLREMRFDFDAIDTTIDWDRMMKFTARMNSKVVSNRITRLYEVMDE